MLAVFADVPSTELDFAEIGVDGIGIVDLVARVQGSGRRKPVLIMGHTDVVTVDASKWTFPPFSATRDGGYIYGRGSLDDKPLGKVKP